MPAAGTIFNLFGRSPIKPLEHHMSKVSACAHRLLPFFNTVLVGDWSQAEVEREHIARLEEEADKLKQDLRMHLPRSLFLPVARGDFLEIITLQDRIANNARDVSGLMFGRRMYVPGLIAPDMISLLGRSLDAVTQAERVVNELDQLLESGFRGDEARQVESMIYDLNGIERDSDELQIGVRQKLFSIESELTPIDAVFLYSIINKVGELADHAQNVGEQLQLLLAQ